MVSDPFAAKRQAHRDRIASPPPGPTHEADAIFARAFSSGAGKEALQAMREKANRPINAFAASESALRASAAQSQFVREIEAAVQRGLDAMITKGKAA